MVKAAVIHEPGPPSVLKYEDVKDVPPLSKNEVKVRHAASGVNFVDCYIRRGEGGYKPEKYPHILGFEGAGPITNLGEGGLSRQGTTRCETVAECSAHCPFLLIRGFLVSFRCHPCAMLFSPVAVMRGLSKVWQLVERCSAFSKEKGCSGYKLGSAK